MNIVNKSSKPDRFQRFHRMTYLSKPDLIPMKVFLLNYLKLKVNAKQPDRERDRVERDERV